MLVIFLLLLAQANMANPVNPGTPAGEPAAALEGLRIVRERLVIDLSEIWNEPRGTIEAEYRIANNGSARTLPLEFLALSDDLEAAQVWVDDQPVPAQRVAGLTVPSSWSVVTQTPALEDETFPYEVSDGFGDALGLRFVATIPTGQHTIRVRYRVAVGDYDGGDHPNLVRQFAYSLAPARLWAGFGQLDLEVRVPPGWDVATSLPLRREGDVLMGRFRGVPGDVLAISARAPVPTLRRPVQIAGVLAWALIAGFGGIVSGRLAVRSGKTARAALPGAIFSGLIAAIVFVVFQLIAVDMGSSSSYGGAVSIMMVGGPLAFVAGIAAAQLAALWAHRHWTPTATP